METTTFNTVSVIISLITLLLSIGGAWAVYYQVKKLKESALTNIHTKWTDQGFEIIRFLNEKPETRAYFYDNKTLRDDTPDRVHILFAAEMLANYMNQLIIQKDYIPNKRWEVWERFITITFELSDVMREFVTEYSAWYDEELLRYVKPTRKLK